MILGLLLGTGAEASAKQESTEAAPSPNDYSSDELVVRYRPGTPSAARAEVTYELGASADAVAGLKGVEVLDLPAGTTVAEAAQAVESLPEVLYAEPNYRVAGTAAPNDPMFAETWSLGWANSQGVNSGIGTPRVWNLTTGSSAVTVAVVDSGVDASHPDLAPNMWTNSREVANGKDDDGNGVVDDLRGWDWVANDADPADENGHGTHVAGVIGAQGNNANGVAGVNWDVSLVPLRVLDAAGSGWTSDVAEAFAYAGKMGVDVVNASLAGNVHSQALLDSIAASPNTLFVVAAGNSSKDVGVTASYPCSYPLPNIICVAATGTSNELSSYSNFGAVSVDLAAPGDAILSTWPGGTYNQAWGTSSASPHVAGVAALLAARHPEASAASIKAAILAGAEPLPGLVGRTVTGGRLSSAGAFESMGDQVPLEDAPARFRQDGGDGDDTPKKRCRTKRNLKRRGDRRVRAKACRMARSR